METTKMHSSIHCETVVFPIFLSFDCVIKLSTFFSKLFWIDTSPQSGALQIETGSFTGSDKKTFQNHLFLNPSGLFFDGGLQL